MRADFPPSTGSRVKLGQVADFNLSGLRVSPSRREVAFEGEMRILEPRVMQVLVALAERRPSVVSRDQLALACWGGLNVGDDAINRCVVALRRLARDFEPQPFTIATVARVGYSLIEAPGTNETFARANGRTLSEGRILQGHGRGIGRRELIIGGGAVALATAGGAAWTLLRVGSMPRDARLLVNDARQSLREATAEQTDNSVGKLRRAVEIAPNSAEAWGMLAYAYERAAAKAPSQDRQNLLARGQEAMRRAFAIEPYQADALTAQVWAVPMFRNWYAYDKAARAACAHHPNHPELYTSLGGLLLQVGRFREALPLYDKALLEMPLSPPVQGSRHALLWSLGRLDEAEAAITKAFELMPRNYAVWFLKLYFFLYTGRAREAVAMVEDKDSRPIGIPDWNYDLTAMQVNAIARGDRAEIRRTIEIWKKAAERGTGFTMNASVFAAWAGDFDECFRLLNTLYFDRGYALPDVFFSKEQGMYQVRFRVTSFLFMPQMAQARRDPRFGLLTRELGLDDYWARTNSRSLVIA